jgi:hypothetical protein
MDKTYTIDEISKLFVGENNKGGYFDEYLDYCIFEKKPNETKLTFKEWFETKLNKNKLI